MSENDRKFYVTLFKDERAQSLSAKEMSLAELQDLVLNTTADTKAKLPLLKLARFGDKRTDNNCLRSNANVDSISGTEGDYDDKEMPFDDAVKLVEKARVKALLYTSSSYTAAEPKWRIVTPTSRDLPPSERAKLTARVNGVLGGILAGESFTLSQAYYFGSVNGNPDHRAVIVEGDFIDLRGDLDATAKGKKGEAFDDAARPQHADNQRPDKQADPDLIYAALAVIPSDGSPYWQNKVLHWEDWNRIGMATFAATNGSQRGCEAWQMWSSKTDKFKDRWRERWDHYGTSPPTDIGAGTIIDTANKALPGWRALIGLSIEKVNEILRLTSFSPAQYEQQRTEAASQLGLRVGALDKIVQSLRFWSESDNDEGQGTRIEVDPTNPWTDAVDGQALVSDMVEAIRSHVILSEHQALATSLWVIHTYAIDDAEHTPRLQIKSPTKRCGKTTLLNTIKPMVSKCVNTENITMAALFRLIEMFQPTLLIDEADTFFKREDGKNNEDINAIMNAGHGRGGTVIRTVGEKFEVRAFQVFAPVAFAWLVKRNMQPSPTLEDRSITIELRRRLKTEKIVRLRSNRNGHLQLLGRKAARWVADHIVALADADPALPEELGDRDHDNWRPLIAIADAISESLGQKARAAVLKIAAEGTGGEEDASVVALADVAAIFEWKMKQKTIHSEKGLKGKDLIKVMVKMTDRPWSDWRRGMPLTEKGLAKLLKPYRVETKTIRIGSNPNDVMRGYETDEVLKAAERFVDVKAEEEEVKEADSTFM